MEVPHGYKQTSIGIIPVDWEIERLGNLITIKSGESPEKFRLLSHPAQYPYLKVEDLNNCEKFQQYSRNYTDDQFSVISENSIIFPKRGASILTNKVRINSVAVQMDSNLMALTKLKPSINFEFLFYKIVSAGLFKIADTSSIPQINNKHIEPYKIPLPPLPEQQKIAEILSTWDTAIETCQKTIEQLKQRNKGLAQQFLTPEENWQKYKVKDVLKEISRPVSWDDEKFYDLISVRRRSGGIFYRQTLQGKEILTKNLSTVKNGDFLISKMQIVHGASALVCENFENMNVSGSYIVTRCRNEEIMDIRFFNYLSKTKRFYHLSYISSYGVHIEKMTFDFKDFQNHSITLPSIAKQKEIITILDTAANELRLYQDKLCYLQNQKKGLMQQLLTGKVRTV